MEIKEIRHGNPTVIELRLKQEPTRALTAFAPVRLFREQNTTCLQVLNVADAVFEVEAADSKNEALLDPLLGRNLPSLSYLVDAGRDRSIIVHTKVFADAKPLDISIGIEDDFTAKAQKQRVVGDYYHNPQAGLTRTFVLNVEGMQYAIMGVHRRVNKKEQMGDFVLAGKEGYVQIKRRTEDDGEVLFVVDRVLPRIETDEYAFVLVKGRIEFKNATFAERARALTLAAIGELDGSVNGYLNTWEQYNRIEQQELFQTPMKAGIGRYSGFEPQGGGEAWLYVVNPDMLANFAEKVKQEPGIILCVEDPAPLFADPEIELDDYKTFLKRQRRVSVRVAKVQTDKARVVISNLPEDLNTIPTEGFFFLSNLGDLKRFERRDEARKRILSGQNFMPHLAAILEGKSIARPAKPWVDPMSPAVRAEIFPKNDPTPKQKEAIEVAINTPDVALIQGPPGTGKTTVIRAILKRLNEMAGHTGSVFGRNLVTAYQHDAVENAVERIKVLGLPALKLGERRNAITDDIQIVEQVVEDWIEDRLHMLYARFPDLVKGQAMDDFDKIHNSYLYSANSIANTLRLLEKVRDTLHGRLTIELLTALNQVISDLRISQSDLFDPARDYLLRSIRRIPATLAAYRDNGREMVQAALLRLKFAEMAGLEAEIAILDRFAGTDSPDEADLYRIAGARKRLLTRLTPQEHIFHTDKQRDDILGLFSRISDHLRNEYYRTKSSEDAVLCDYIAEFENSPLAIRNTILDYVSVIGVTNQQVKSQAVTRLKGDTEHYDNVLVDEAARSNPMDLFIPLSLAKDRIILVGDHRQLPHLVDQKIVTEIERVHAEEGESILDQVNQNIKDSMFQRLFRILNQLEKKDGVKRTVTLDKQYRTHPVLGEFISRNFYVSHGDVELESPMPADNFAHSLPGLEGKAAVWYDVPFSEGREVPGQSKSRPVEAVKIAGHLKQMLESEAAKDLTFGIITFYANQRELIFEELAKVGIAIKHEDGTFELPGKLGQRLRIGTVDAFQGMEFDVVYLSMVRSNRAPDRTEEEKRKKYGHLMVENRLCVSMSRQKRLLIVVGDSGMLQAGAAKKVIPSLVEYYALCGGDQTYGRIIP